MKDSAMEAADRLIRIMKQEKDRSGITWDKVEKKAGLGSYCTRNWIIGQCMPSLVAFIQALNALGLELCIRRKRDAE